MQVNRAKRFFLVVFVLLAAGAASLWISHKVGGSVQPVQVGDTKNAVLAKLGEPTAIFTNWFVLLEYGGEVWAYGPVLDLKRLGAGNWPFKLRVLGPDVGDYVVVFDTSDRVKRIQKVRK